MTDLNTLSRMLAEHDAKRGRMDAARAARAALRPEELAEFLAESVAYYQALTTDKANVPAPIAPQATLSIIPPAPTADNEPRPTLRSLITNALRVRPNMGMGDIFLAVSAMQPDAKYVSVASEIKRMKNNAPPLLVEVDRNEKGHALYALTRDGAR